MNRAAPRPIGLLLLLPVVMLTACGPAVPADWTVTFGVPKLINQTPGLAVEGALVAVSWTAVDVEAGNVADAYVAVSHDGARTFGSPVRVNDVAGEVRPSEQQAPRIAVRDGMIAVMWTSRREAQTQIRVAVSVDGGRAFAPSRLLSPPGLPGTRGWGALTIDESRRIHAVWLDTRISALAAAASKTAPAKPHVHGAASSASPTRQDIYAATVDADGRIEERMVATAVCFCCKTAITRSGATTWAAFRDVYPGSLRDITLARLDDSSDSGRARVSEDGWRIEGCPEDGPALAAANGRIDIVWPSLVVAEPMTKGVFYAKYTDGRTFSPRVRLDGGSGSAMRPVVSVAESRGVRAVAWEILDRGTHRIELRRSTRSGEWLPIEVLASGPLVSSPAMAAFADGLVAAWGRKSDGESTIEVRRMSLR